MTEDKLTILDGAFTNLGRIALNNPCCLDIGRVRNRRQNCTQREDRTQSTHPNSLPFTTSPPCVSRTALPISSSSTGLPASLSQKAERKL